MKERIRTILEKTFETNIDDNFTKDNAENWDSLNHLDILVQIEEEFGISFTPKEIGSIDSFQEIINVVEQKLKK